MEKIHPSPLRAWLSGVLCLFFGILLLQVLLAAVHVVNDGFLLTLALIITFALYMALAYLQSTLTSYSLENGMIVMEKSALSSDRQVIPAKSVDNMHVKASFLARLLGLCDVYVDTPGGFGFELVMRDLPRDSAEELMHEVQKIKEGGQ